MTPAPVYLDHAASTPMWPEVVDTMERVLRCEPGNPTGLHAVAQAAKTLLEEARETIAGALGAEPGEIVLTGSGTEADNLAVLGAARSARASGRGDGVVTTAFEHKGVLAPADHLAREGFTVRRASVDRDGLVDLDHLRACLDERTVVVSVMLVNNEVGTVQPLDEVADAVRELAPQAVLHTDAVQGAPWLDVATLARRADLVSVSAHKLGGPKGVGALVVRRGVELEPLLLGGGQERGLRSGTSNVAGAVGLAVALRATGERRSATVPVVAALRDRLADELLRSVPDAFENGDRARKVAGNCHLGFRGIDAEMLLVALDRAGICAAAGSSCASGAAEPSHVLTAMGIAPSDAGASVRLSLGLTSTAGDVDRALDVIPSCVARLRAHAVAAAVEG